MQTNSPQNPNKTPVTLLWIGFSCVVLTAFLPVITFTFLFSFDFLIYDVLSELGLVFFFGGLVAALVGAIAKNNSTTFKVCSFLATGLAIFPIISILSYTESAAFSMSIGFYTYAIGTILCLVAGIMYKSPIQLKQQSVQTGQIHQPLPTQPQVYPRYPQQELQPLEQPQRPEGTMFCPYCREINEVDINFCVGCGKELR